MEKHQARPSRRLIAILFALALLPRLAAVVAVPDVWLEGHGTDAETYWRLAEHLLETGVYGGVQGEGAQRGVPDAYLPPIYPLLLAGATLLFGSGAAAVNVVQALLGALACVLVFYVAILAFADRRTAWLSFIANASYPILLLWVNLHLTETLYILLLNGMVLCLTLTLKRYRPGYALLAGVLYTLTMLTREALVLFLPLLVLFWLIDRYDWRRKGIALASFLLGVLIAFAPWWVRNATVLDRMVFTTGRVDRHLRELIAFVTPFDLPWEQPGVSLSAPQEEASGVPVDACSAGAVYGAFLERSVPQGMERSPAETCCRYHALLRPDASPAESFSLLVACFVETWLHPNGLWSVPGGAAQGLYLLAHGSVMLAALVGMVISLRRREAWPMVLLLIYGTVTHVTQGALPRYVLPYMPLVFVFAARALLAGYDALRRRRPPEEPA